MQTPVAKEFNSVLEEWRVGEKIRRQGLVLQSLL